MPIELLWKGVMALIGCFAAAYVGQQLLGGGVGGGIILVGTCLSLFKALMVRRKLRR